MHRAPASVISGHCLASRTGGLSRCRQRPQALSVVLKQTRICTPRFRLLESQQARRGERRQEGRERGIGGKELGGRWKMIMGGQREINGDFVFDIELFGDTPNCAQSYS